MSSVVSVKTGARPSEMIDRGDDHDGEAVRSPPTWVSSASPTAAMRQADADDVRGPDDADDPRRDVATRR